MSGLAPLCKNLAVKQQKQAFALTIEQIKEILTSWRSGEIWILHLVENANILDKMTVTARELFLAQSDESIQNDVKLFYIDIIDQIMTNTTKIFSSLKKVRNTIKLSHRMFPLSVHLAFLSTSRSFWSILGLEWSLKLLSPSSIIQQMKKYDANLIWDAHSLISAIEKDMKSKYIEQEDFRDQHAESMKNEVNASLVGYNDDWWSWRLI